MCGIAGIVGALESDSVRRVQQMLGALEHRGPDQHGLWCSGETGTGAVLGHRRLSIIDLSEAGRQPMVHPESGVALSYNGECYNYLELRAQLEGLGHAFHSRSDTEVILKAYVQWGEGAIERLRGMFALVIWDPRDRALLAVRDRMGIKPLYYATNSAAGGGAQVAFASELRALAAVNPQLGRLDPQAISAYLWHGFVPGPRTMFDGVRLLEPGCMARFGENGRLLRERTYWQIPRSDAPANRARAATEAAEELDRAVSLRLVSDVPLGVFLSGGIDSSVIATIAQRRSRNPIQTFNISFEDPEFDESSYATRVAAALGTDHHDIPLNEETFRQKLPAALHALDQPTFDAINTYFVSRAVREAGLTVALSGAGGDELFGGYASFRDLPRAQRVSAVAGWLPRRLSRAVGRAASRALLGAPSEVEPQTRWGKLADMVDSRGDLVAAYQCSYALFTQTLLRDLQLNRNTETRWGLYPELHSKLEREIRGVPALPAISHLELSSFIGQRLLRDTDTASMAVSLEARVPLLDHQFIEAVSRLVVSDRFLPLGRKSFLRDVMAGDVPPEIFDRPKAGFVLPLEKWCKRSLLPEIEATFEDLNLANRVGLNCESVSRVWRAFKKGGPGLYWSRVW
ncbi:MAG: asparagine synthase (glutamine-hydrolyzing), partial [Pseudomonadales bacterium]